MDELRKKGFRITNQRRVLIDVILENECSCNKEIYYLALQKDSSVSMATVYRMVKTLEELGAIDRKNMYKITCEEVHSMGIPDDIWLQRVKKLLRDHQMISEDEELFIRIQKKGEEGRGDFVSRSCDDSCCQDYCKRTI